MSDQLPAAGWYVNAEGRTQWWDGTAWGRLAADAPDDAADDAAEPAEPSFQPVAQEFSREFLEEHYGSNRAEESDSPETDSASAEAAPTAPPAPVSPAPSQSPPLFAPPAGAYAPPAAPAHTPGAYAAPYPQQAQPSYPNYPGYPGQQSQFPPPAYAPAAPAAPKPPTHMFTWFGLGAVALGLVFAIFGAFTWSGWPTGLAWLSVIAGIVFSIIALVKSEKKALPIVALVLSVTGLAWVPIVTFVGALVVWANEMPSAAPF